MTETLTPRPEAPLAAANDYFAGRLRVDAWTDASQDERVKALSQASFLVSGAFTFSRDAYELGPQGEFVWNERVQAAVCEEALWLLQRDPTQLPAFLNLGLVQGSVGGVSATFDRAFVAPLICDACKRLIGRLGVFDALDEDGTLRSTPLAL